MLLTTRLRENRLTSLRPFNCSVFHPPYSQARLPRATTTNARCVPRWTCRRVLRVQVYRDMGSSRDGRADSQCSPWSTIAGLFCSAAMCTFASSAMAPDPIPATATASRSGSLLLVAADTSAASGIVVQRGHQSGLSAPGSSAPVPQPPPAGSGRMSILNYMAADDPNLIALQTYFSR